MTFFDSLIAPAARRRFSITADMTRWSRSAIRKRWPMPFLQACASRETANGCAPGPGSSPSKPARNVMRRCSWRRPNRWPSRLIEAA